MPFEPINHKSRVALSVAAICAALLSGCSSGDGVGQFMVDPALFDAYNCKDLVTVWQNLNKREAELKVNIERADQSSSGKVIGAMAYGSDYQTVLTQKKMVQQQASIKKCDLGPTYQSDQTVR